MRSKRSRYLRAFIIALQRTLRGEPPPPPKYARLRAWMEEATRLTDAVLQIADRTGFPAEQQEQLRLVIDKRPISMQTIVKGVRYHLTEEYPHVLENDATYGQTAIYSSNLNDQYRVARLVEAVEPPELKAAVQQLAAWLAAIPSTSDEKLDNLR